MFGKELLKKKVLCFSIATSLLVSIMPVCGAVKGINSKGTEPQFDTESIIVVMSQDKELTCEEVKNRYAHLEIENVIDLDKGVDNSKSGKNKSMKFVLKNKSRNSVLKAVEKLKNSPGILTAEPNYTMAKCATTPNDTNYNLQSNMRLISADKAWDLTTGSPDITVGIVDSGVYIDNKDLLPNAWINENEIFNNYIDDDGNGYVDDYFGYNFDDNNGDCLDDDGHGTLCAGLVAAQGNNYSQIAGVSWNTKIISLRVQGTSHHTATVESMVAAVNYASQMGIPILNISMGTYGYSQALYDAIKAYPGLVVAAAGNYASNNDSSPFYPASFDLDNIISVASTDGSDILAPDSNYGSTSVDLTAPGEKIIWSTGTGTNLIDSGNGTSMAAPQVAGAAALIMAYKPSYSVSDVKKAILSSVDVISGLSGKVATSGRLNVYNALLYQVPDNTPPTASGFYVYNLQGSTLSTILSNHEGELWSNKSYFRAKLNGVTDTNGVQGVQFYVSNYDYPDTYSSTIVNGIQDPGTNSWYADIPVGGNNMTIQAFPIDNLGNTLINSMKGNSSYKYTKSFNTDYNTPGGYTNIEPQGSYLIDASNRYVTNANQVKIRVNAHDTDGAPWSSSSIKSVALRIYRNGSSSYENRLAKYVSGNANRSGDYEYVYIRPNVTAENSYKVVAIITDYAGNSYSAEPKYFVFDTQSPRGTVSTPSSTVYGDSFDVYINNVQEASNVTRILFPTWTDYNGQDDLIWYEGYRVGEKEWKITINRSNHKYEKGLYYIHVYTEDSFGNFAIAGATEVTLY